VLGARAIDFTRLQTADKKTHPFPSGLLARQRQEFACSLLRQVFGMDEKAGLAQIFSFAMRSRPIRPWGIVFV
jgi:hypothetical protein